MKQVEHTSITAIATTINGATTYIAGQSVREDNKYVPQFNPDPVHAKEFTDHADAQTYIDNIHNPFHRVYVIVVARIPSIKDLKKYDRDKKRLSITDNSYQGGIRHGQRIRGPIASIIACIVLVSCSKSQVLPPKRITDSYKMFVEQYTLDTVLLNSIIWWQDTLSNPKEKIKIDTLHPKWYRICDSNNKPTHLDYIYYTRNGIKIQ